MKNIHNAHALAHLVDPCHIVQSIRTGWFSPNQIQHLLCLNSKDIKEVQYAIFNILYDSEAEGYTDAAFIYNNNVVAFHRFEHGKHSEHTMQLILIEEWLLSKYHEYERDGAYS